MCVPQIGHIQPTPQMKPSDSLGNRSGSNSEGERNGDASTPNAVGKCANRTVKVPVRCGPDTTGVHRGSTDNGSHLSYHTRSVKRLCSNLAIPHEKHDEQQTGESFPRCDRKSLLCPLFFSFFGGYQNYTILSSRWVSPHRPYLGYLGSCRFGEK